MARLRLKLTQIFYFCAKGQKGCSTLQQFASVYMLGFCSIDKWTNKLKFYLSFKMKNQNCITKVCLKSFKCFVEFKIPITKCATVPTALSFHKLQYSRTNADELLRNLQSAPAIVIADSDSSLYISRINAFLIRITSPN